MTETWTDSQSDAISIRDKNILVSAAAGSGKTAVLVERIRRLIIDEHVSVDEILVATFTNAAASDMKEKIVKAIKEAVSENPADAQFLRNQFNKVYKANISTFHSFVIEVIRRYFYIINVDPDFKICDDPEKIILQTEAMDELFEDRFEAAGEGFINFLKDYCTAKSEKKAKDMILYIYDVIRSLPEPFEWLGGKVEMIDSPDEKLYEYLAPFIMKDVVENMECALGALQSVHNILEGGGASRLAGKCLNDIARVSDILRDARAGDYEAAASGIRGMRFERLSACSEEKAAYDEIKGGAGKLRDMAKERIKQIRDDYFRAEFREEANLIRATYASSKVLLDLVSDFDRRYSEKKREKALLDFSDTEHFAIAILKNADVAKEYRNKFKYIFVDEYQDSNLIQETIVNLIKRDDNVFMVGDVKQSIYKFRLAEPELFMAKYESYKNAPGGKDLKIDLNTNFRCKGNIINAVNDVCRGIMPYDEEAALKKGVKYTGELDRPVSLHIVDAKEIEANVADSEINELKRVELEAGVAAGLIKDVVGKDIYAEAKDGEGAVRKIEFRDIVILMRGIRNYGEKFYRILSDNGIPAYIDDSDGYFDAIEIEVFMNLLKIIDNKRRDVPLISVLHSSIMNFSVSELSRIRIEGGQGPYCAAFEKYKDFGNDPDLRMKCQNAYERIGGWRNLSLSAPLYEFIWELLLDTGYYIYAGALPGGGQRQANLRALADKSLKYARTRTDGLYGFIRYAETLKEKGVQTGQVSLAGESDDVVRIKTVHKSKGLEFPVVIISGLGRRFIAGRERSNVYAHKDIGAGLPFYDRTERKLRKTLLQIVIERKNRREEMDEEARILYVAMTRAKDMLFLTGTVTDAEKALENYRIPGAENQTAASCYLDMVAPVLLAKKMPCEIYDRNSAATVKTKSGAFKDELRGALTAARPDTTPQAAKTREFIDARLSYEYPDQKALAAKSKYSVSEIGRAVYPAETEKAVVAPLFMQAGKKPTGAEIGAAIHVAMEKMDFKTAALKFESGETDGLAYLADLVEALKERGHFTEAEAGMIDPERLAMFIKSDIGKRAAAADKIFKETPFNLIKEMDGTETIIQGVIDCYFEEDGEYVLLDYKSGYISGKNGIEYVKKMYGSQLSIYCEALETIKNIRVKEKYLYLFGVDAAVLL